MGRDRRSASADGQARWSRWRFCALVLVTYLVSFALPVFDNTGAPPGSHDNNRIPGVVVGWGAFILGVGCPSAWLANLGVWVGVGLLASGRPRAAAIVGGVALLLGSSALVQLTDNSLVYHQRFEVGYFCWLASSALLTGAGLGLGWLRPGWRPAACMAVSAVVALAITFGVEKLIVAWSAPPTDAVLKERLQSGRTATRLQAYRALRTRGVKEEFLPVLIDALNDSDDQVRAEAALTLGLFGPRAKAAVPALIAILEGPAPEGQGADSRIRAAEALGAIGPDAKAAVPSLLAALNDENVAVRRAAASSLGHLGPEARAGEAALTKALADPDDGVRRSAIWSLENLGPGPDSIAAIQAATSDSDWHVRNTAQKLLKALPEQPHGKGDMRDKRAEPAAAADRPRD
jgi:hypothetical protein